MFHESDGSGSIPPEPQCEECCPRHSCIIVLCKHLQTFLSRILISDYAPGICFTRLSACNPMYWLVHLLDFWSGISNGCNCVPDYLKNLSEDSEDYKDTQGKTRSSFYILKWNENGFHLISDFHIFVHSAALVIVKEVANHANDIMKQGVRASKK